MSYAQMAGGAISAGVSIYGTWLQSKAEENQALAERNTQLLQQGLQIRQARAEEINQRLVGERRLAQIAPQAAKAGVTTESRSVLEIQLEAGRLAEYDVEMAGYNSRLGAWSSGYNASLKEWEAGNIRAQRPMMMALAGLSSIASSLGGVTSIQKSPSAAGGGGTTAGAAGEPLGGGTIATQGSSYGFNEMGLAM